MDYTDNNPSGTDSLNMTADEAVNMLSNVDIATDNGSQFDDENASDDVEAGASDEVEIDADEEQPETDSDADEIDADADGSDEEATDEGSELAFDDEAEVSIGNEKVKFKELKAGYLRQADYTRKTTALAAERTEFTTQRDQVASAMRQHQMNELRINHQILSHFTIPAPTIELADTAPGEYTRQKAAHDQQAMAIEAYRQRYAQIQEAETQAQANAHKALQLSEQEKMFELIPEIDFRKGAKETAYRDAFFRYGAEIFGADAINNLADAKMMQTLYKAYLYDEGQKRAAKVAPKIASKPSLTKPSRKAPTTAETEQRKAMEKLGRTGSVEDAVAALSRLKL